MTTFLATARVSTVAAAVGNVIEIHNIRLGQRGMIARSAMSRGAHIMTSSSGRGGHG